MDSSSKTEFEKHKLDSEQCEVIIKKRGDLLQGPAQRVSQSLYSAAKRNQNYNHKRRIEMVREMEALSVEDRMAVFSTLGPIAPAAELAWQALAHQPVFHAFSMGWCRAPGNAEALTWSRYGWLFNLVSLTRPFQQDYEFYLEWASHFSCFDGILLGTLFAAVIDAGGPLGEKTLQKLIGQAVDPEVVGEMGWHVIAGLLNCSREEGWAALEKLLLAAQRQEGLRQTILEQSVHAHPQAYQRMLRLILEHDLVRFSSVARIIDMWFGQQWDATGTRQFRKIVESALRYLEDPEARRAALSIEVSAELTDAPAASKKTAKDEADDGAAPSAAQLAAREAYFALWAEAYFDAAEACRVALALMKHPLPTHRLAAVVIAARVNAAQPAGEPGWPVMLAGIADENLTVALNSFASLRTGNFASYLHELQVEADRQHVASSPLALESLATLLNRMPLKGEKNASSLLFPWLEVSVEASSVADEMTYRLGKRSGVELVPYIGRMSPSGRQTSAKVLGRTISDPECVAALLGLASDRSPEVSATAFAQLLRAKLSAADALGLEANLKRKAELYRRGALKLLAAQDPNAALDSAERLLQGKEKPQRIAGLNLLLEIRGKHVDLAPAIASKAEAYRARVKASPASAAAAAATSATSPSLEDPEEQGLLERLLPKTQPSSSPAAGSATATEAPAVILEPMLSNALGLVRLEEIPLPRPMDDKGVPLITNAAVHLLESLNEEIDRHSRTEITVRKHGYFVPGEEEGKAAVTETILLNQAEWYTFRINETASYEANAANIPLKEVWDAWWEARPADCRDADGGEILRAIAGVSHIAERPRAVGWRGKHLPGVELLLKETAVHRKLLSPILKWLLYSQRHKDPVLAAQQFALVLDTCETAAFHYAEHHLQPKNGVWDPIPGTPASHVPEPSDGESPLGSWIDLLESLEDAGAQLTEPQVRQKWDIQHWMWRPTVRLKDGTVTAPTKFGMKSEGLNHLEVAKAFQRGWIGRDAVIFYLIGRAASAAKHKYGYLTDTFREFGLWTRPFKEMRQIFAETPALPKIVDEVRDRVLEIEFKRSDPATPATQVATFIQRVAGVDRFVQLLQLLKDSTLVRTPCYNSADQTRVVLFSALLRVAHPMAGETDEEISAAIAAANIKPQRLVEVAFFAPQWASHIQRLLDWPGLRTTVMWYVAHTKDYSVAQMLQEVLEGLINEGNREQAEWMADISEHTALSPHDLGEGAVDVRWFHECVAQLGEKRWKLVHDAAKYASDGTGHARAKIFADAMLDRIPLEKLIERVTQKRHQDSVRCLGLVPLKSATTDPDAREKEVLQRYETLMEFRRGSKQFGSMRQNSEKRAVEIGMANLARTAGYADPVRLEWAMEGKSVEDLASGSISLTSGDVTVTLSINPWSEPEITATKADPKGGEPKPLKEVPAKAKKEPEIAALTARKAKLKRQLSRMRASLEAMMNQGEQITGRELNVMFANPLLRHMLTQLVFLSDDGSVAGYPGNEGRTLTRHDGSVQAVGNTDLLRLAHPHDLLASGQWAEWQRECFAHERIQPFKQVFRELYPLTPAERADGKTETDRYAGHQVNPRQALALLGGRGWLAVAEEGVRKTFHREGVTVWLRFEESFMTPAEIEGLTLEAVEFFRRDNGKDIRLTDVNPRLFSEVMRDMDLIVSVAHMGGVDPEASQSTIEMRRTLVEETARLLRLKNLELKEKHVLITGTLASYSLHLGSAVSHKVPGGALFIVPVRSQHRGRIFLPFADSDPKTAELLSKVILLARDKEIKDPGILDQIR